MRFWIFSEEGRNVKWSQGVGDEGRLPGSTKNFFVVCGHEFEVRPLGTVVWFVSSCIFMWMKARGSVKSN